MGCSGGLALFWKDNLHVDFLFVDKNLIDMKVSSASHSWFVTCVYGNPVTSLRSIVWDKLTTFGLTRSKAWCMIGDFNAILSNEKKLGGPLRDLISFHSFQSMLADCDMSEMVLLGEVLETSNGFNVNLTEVLLILLGSQCFPRFINGFWRSWGLIISQCW